MKILSDLSEKPCLLFTLEIMCVLPISHVICSSVTSVIEYESAEN